MDLKKKAIFTCETNGGDLTLWKVNGSSILPPEISDDIHTDQETVGKNDWFALTILARAVYNGTTIQCVTGRFGGVPVESSIFNLTIRGIVYVACCT